MAVKYRLKYYDVVNIEHECKIYDDNYVGDIIEIQGNVFLDYTSIDNNLEVIRSQGLRVELEANENLTYDDLYSEEEKSFPVEYYRDGELKFTGWLNPEGWYEDFVRDEWIVSFDCIDGLGYLENLSFVNDDTTLIRGRISQIEALYKALKRTGIDKKIRVAIDIYYTGLTPDTQSIPILTNVYVTAERYIKDDGETIMSCEEVIKDILEPYGAVLTSYGDSWYIYKPNELYLDTTRTFYEYDTSGTFAGIFTYDFAREIGSNINNYDIFHCSENQQFTVKPSIGAHRISYKYGDIQPYLDNERLVSDDGTTIDDWEILSTTNLDTPFPIGTGGVGITAVALGSIIEQLRTEPAIILSDETVAISINFSDPTPIFRQFVYQVYIADEALPGTSPTIYYLQNDNTWSTSSDKLFTSKIDYGGGVTIELTTPSKPAGITGDGYMYVSIWTPNRTQGGVVTLNKVTMKATQAIDAIEGEFHTFKRTTKPSAQVKDIKEVATGDNIEDLYLGTIYKTDASTPTETWFRKGFTEAKPILQLMGEETMRMNQLPTRVYRGSVFNYLPILSVIDINNINGKFMINEYSYNTKQNTIDLVARQILGNELTDLDYKKTEDKGETVEPTIEG